MKLYDFIQELERPYKEEIEDRRSRARHKSKLVYCNVCRWGRWYESVKCPVCEIYLDNVCRHCFKGKCKKCRMPECNCAHKRIWIERNERKTQNLQSLWKGFLPQNEQEDEDFS